jgi:hypothetical protein
MQRRQTDESVTGAGRTVRILGARHERKCPLGVSHWEWVLRIKCRPYLTLALSLPLCGPERELKRRTPKHEAFADASRAAASRQSTDFSCRPRAKIIRQPEALNYPETIRPPATPYRARGSERPAVRGIIHLPAMAGRCWRRGGVSRHRRHERRQPRAAVIIVSGDRERLRAVTIERTRTLFAEAWPANEAGCCEDLHGAGWL